MKLKRFKEHNYVKISLVALSFLTLLSILLNRSGYNYTDGYSGIFAITNATGIGDSTYSFRSVLSAK